MSALFDEFYYYLKDKKMDYDECLNLSKRKQKEIEEDFFKFINKETKRSPRN